MERPSAPREPSPTASRTFYDELMDVFAELRRDNTEGHYSFRSAVVQGLGLRDSFTAKIKSGAYRPTIDRLISLARFLGIHPSRFPSYAYRLAQHAIAHDRRVIGLFQILSSLDKETYDNTVDDMLRLARERKSGDKTRTPKSKSKSERNDKT